MKCSRKLSRRSEWIASPFPAPGPDKLRLPSLSREERLTKSMPPVVVEMLEQRRLMALTIDLDAGVLSITGTSGNDSISVYRSAVDAQIYVTDSSTTYGPYNPNNITSYIKVLAGAGLDTIRIDRSANNSVTKSCQLYGEADDDSIDAGDLADTLYGGAGYDQLYGEGGNDVFYGEGGGDWIYGGAGADSLYGGDSTDLMYGEAGTDKLWGDAGNDTLRGGDDADTLYGGDNNDSMLGENDDDHLLSCSPIMVPVGDIDFRPGKDREFDEEAIQ